VLCDGTSILSLHTIQMLQGESTYPSYLPNALC
jgi:hypothetical protein